MQFFILSVVVLLAMPVFGHAQERRKIRISNAGFTITALPLLAAKDWGTFSANALDVELIVMSPSIAAAALAQGDIDYVAGVGPASVAATLSGLQSRAVAQLAISPAILAWRVEIRESECTTGKD